MTTAADPARSSAHVASSKPANRTRHQANLKKYGHPLPILLPTPVQQSKASNTPGILSSYLPTFLFPSSASARPNARIEFPVCVGEYDPVTRSVLVTNEKDKVILFRRGFFGKGNLSRSEPTWRDRRLDQLRGGESAAAEKIRENRRLERKAFKIKRAQAMLDAAKAAEAVLTTGQTPALAQEGDDPFDNEKATGIDGRVSPTPSSSTTATVAAVDLATLTPQTFLVRPTRPDANRNRGKKAFKRRPQVKPGLVNGAPQAESEQTGDQTRGASGGPTPHGTGAAKVVQSAAVEVVFDVDEAEEGGASEDDIDESAIEQMEHLQLSLEEAWFLSAGLGVLKILDPNTNSYPPVSSLLPLFLTPPTISLVQVGFPETIIKTVTPISLRPDDPFLVSYVAYHHFRSLGWVVKPGIKFCCDWLLYRRGPVFSHSPFSCVIIPVYDAPSDRDASPYGHEDWYEERMSWKWMNTVMRVNSLVQKTVILVYVTIPSLSSFPANSKVSEGTLDPRKNDMASLLKRYNVREVSLMRFGPARRRD